MTGTVERAVGIVHASCHNLTTVHENTCHRGFSFSQGLLSNIDGLLHELLVILQVLLDVRVEPSDGSLLINWSRSRR